MQVNGDTLSIIEADRGIMISFFVFSEEKVEIFLPKGYKGTVKTAVSSGNIRLEFPEESEFDYEGYASSGTIKTDFNEMLSFNEKRNEAKGSYGSTPGMRVRTKASSGNTHIFLK